MVRLVKIGPDEVLEKKWKCEKLTTTTTDKGIHVFKSLALPPLVLLNTRIDRTDHCTLILYLKYRLFFLYLETSFCVLSFLLENRNYGATCVSKYQ